MISVSTPRVRTIFLTDISINATLVMVKGEKEEWGLRSPNYCLSTRNATNLLAVVRDSLSYSPFFRQVTTLLHQIANCKH